MMLIGIIEFLEKNLTYRYQDCTSSNKEVRISNSVDFGSGKREGTHTRSELTA
jgi:hypothetical protein